MATCFMLTSLRPLCSWRMSQHNCLYAWANADVLNDIALWLP